MTLGTDRVRLNFNPSKDDLVGQIKLKTAELIDLCNQGQLDADMRSEPIRCWALAMTHYEIAAMFAVKAATADK